MYDLQRRHLEITVSETSGTGAVASWRDVYGWMMSANGSRDFLRSEPLVGTAFIVERMNIGGQLAVSDGVTDDFLCREEEILLN